MLCNCYFKMVLNIKRKQKLGSFELRLLPTLMKNIVLLMKVVVDSCALCEMFFHLSPGEHLAIPRRKRLSPRKLESSSRYQLYKIDPLSYKLLERI